MGGGAEIATNFWEQLKLSAMFGEATRGDGMRRIARLMFPPRCFSVSSYSLNKITE